ncbi:MAG: trigger factor [Lachnospiraceae bacterium]|nr:trigger factor [Lachnospiraceae bacterium]
MKNSKKLAMLLACTLLSALLIPGCGKKDAETGAAEGAQTENAEAGETAAVEAAEAKTYPAEAYLYGNKADEFVVPADYSEIKLSVEEPEVTDDYVDYYIEYLLSQNKEYEEVTGRPVQKGDTVNIDYEGKKDGVAFDGGTAQGASLTIGSGQFIDGFEDGLIGHEIGETVDLPLTFPEEYFNADLAGADVVFTVTINGITLEKIPELTDDWVKAQAKEGVENVDQFRASVREELEQQAKESYENSLDEEIIAYLDENSTKNKDMPAAMVERMTDSYTNTITQYAAMYGTDVAGFMQAYYGSTAESYEDDIRGLAEDTAYQYMVLQAIADKENLNPTTDDVNAYVKENGITLTPDEDLDSLKEFVMTEKVLDFLKERVKNTPPAAEAAAETETPAETEEAAETESAAGTGN